MQAFLHLQQFFKAIWPVQQPETFHPPLEEGPPTPTNTLQEHSPSTPVYHNRKRHGKQTAPTSSVFNHTPRRQSFSRTRHMASASSRTSVHEEERHTTATSSPTGTTPPRSESPWQDVTPASKATHATAPSLLLDTRVSDKVKTEGVESGSLHRTSKSPRSRKAKGMLAHLRKHGTSMVLKNTGSVARDHLASERTFLAYVRTSLALASMGVALVQLFTIAEFASRGSSTPIPMGTQQMQQFAKPLGITTVVFSLIVLLVGVYRFFVVQYALPQGNFPIARVSVAFTSFVFTSIVVVIFGALLSSRAK